VSTRRLIHREANDLMMDRRRFIAVVAGAGTVPIAGCGAGVFEVTSGERSETGTGQTDSLAAVDGRLERIFTRLSESNIVANGEPAVTPEAYSDQEIEILRAELKRAKAAFAEATGREVGEAATDTEPGDGEGTEPSTVAVRVAEQGVRLAAVRLRLHEVARGVAVQDQAAYDAFESQELVAVKRAAIRVRELAGEVSDAATRCDTVAGALASGERGSAVVLRFGGGPS